MTNPMLADPKVELIHYIDTLRGYAKSSVMLGEDLRPDDAANQMALMRSCLTIGGALGLTKKEIVGLILGPDAEPKRECGCHSCDARKNI